MISFYLDKEKSKTFIEYYDKEENHLRIHYGDKSTHIVPYSKITEKRLNSKMEEQVKTFSSSNYNSLEEKKKNANFSKICLYICGGIAIEIHPIFAIPFMGFAIKYGYKASVCGRILKDFKKNSLYVEYKNEIQDYLDDDKQDKAINLTEKEDVLSINDVHNMSYREMKKMTDDISCILDEINKARQRDKDLGLEPREISFKEKVKEMKRR